MQRQPDPQGALSAAHAVLDQLAELDLTGLGEDALLGFWRELERLRRRIPSVEHGLVLEAEGRGLPEAHQLRGVAQLASNTACSPAATTTSSPNNKAGAQPASTAAPPGSPHDGLNRNRSTTTCTTPTHHPDPPTRPDQSKSRRRDDLPRVDQRPSAQAEAANAQQPQADQRRYEREQPWP